MTAGRATVGVRVPDSIVARALLERVGRPVAAPSANRSTRVSPTRAEHVRKDLDGRVAMILDAGPTPLGIESSVLDLTSDLPRLLRPGAITARQIASVLGVEIESHVIERSADDAMSSPGQLTVHYAPRARVSLIEPDEIGRRERTDKWGLIVAGRDLPAGLGAPDSRVDWTDPVEAERLLYATLHDWDELGLESIDVVLPPAEDRWLAVRDRLWRASRAWSREGVERER